MFEGVTLFHGLEHLRSAKRCRILITLDCCTSAHILYIFLQHVLSLPGFVPPCSHHPKPSKASFSFASCLKDLLLESRFLLLELLQRATNLLGLVLMHQPVGLFGMVQICRAGPRLERIPWWDAFHRQRVAQRTAWLARLARLALAMAGLTQSLRCCVDVANLHVWLRHAMTSCDKIHQWHHVTDLLQRMRFLFSQKSYGEWTRNQVFFHPTGGQFGICSNWLFNHRIGSILLSRIQTSRLQTNLIIPAISKLALAITNNN